MAVGQSAKKAMDIAKTDGDMAVGQKSASPKLGSLLSFVSVDFESQKPTQVPHYFSGTA